ncbi:DUF1398 family protein [Sphingobium lignivorans]|uniref:Uncharacterized protein YbcV (DUF1398 family) n=1 Tax=Sphingobium lignivorans TaxID=2735886 RepID=A0ABR6NAU3_9SPHN|nr:DUF1398 family protein [Sphingobium lignivorans]MBB5984374.1 uncharacterized protein YbcV (DUF1398 family) [Sphingobium lignivorans]
MQDELKDIAARCLAGAEDDSMTFPQIVGALIDAGFEGYAVDYRAGTASYYLPAGRCFTLPIRDEGPPVAAAFDAPAIRAAIAQAQALAPGYTYAGFCRTVRDAGCAGYLVSFSGRRALYYGRTAETHVELFPDAP